MTGKAHTATNVVVATAVLICDLLLSPRVTHAITPTHPPSPTIRSLTGTVLAPGATGLEPRGGVEVEAFPCNLSACLDDADVGPTAETSPTGELALTLATTSFIVVRAALDGDMLRAIGYDADPIVAVDPMSEAMVRLLAERDLSVYTSAQLRLVEDAVRLANAAADFAALTVADAVILALANAEADSAVAAALVAWTPTPRPTTTPTATATATSTPYPAVATATRRPCVGDCDRSAKVTVDELVAGVRILLGTAEPDLCAAFTHPRIEDLVQAVANALGDCVPPPPLPDLVIDSERVYVYGDVCRSGHCGSACVVNAGNAPAGSFALFFGVRLELPGLAPGAGQCVNVCLEALPYMGDVTVDIDDAVEELDEGNNTFSFTHPTPTRPPSCP